MDDTTAINEGDTAQDVLNRLRDRPGPLQEPIGVALSRLVEVNSRMLNLLMDERHPGAAGALMPPSRSLDYANAIASETPADTTIEAIWDKARQLHAVCQDLPNAFGSMIYGPSPATQALQAPPASQDRLQATWETLNQALDMVNQVADAMRRRA